MVENESLIKTKRAMKTIIKREVYKVNLGSESLTEQGTVKTLASVPEARFELQDLYNRARKKFGDGNTIRVSINQFYTYKNATTKMVYSIIKK